MSIISQFDVVCVYMSSSIETISRQPNIILVTKAQTSLGQEGPPWPWTVQHTHTHSTLSCLLWLLKQVFTHRHTRTTTHTAVVMWVDWSLNKGHGQSQAAQTASDPEKHPLPDAQSVTVLGQAWPHAYTHPQAHALSWLLAGRQTNLSVHGQMTAKRLSWK